jgi:nitrogen-specific signal transduction histidine kinase/CheY-like chemotaxis protein
VGVVLAFRDVTAQKELQDQLLLSDRMVSLGTLAAGVAHEINNPLAALIGNLDVLMSELSRPREGVLPASVDDVLHDIREAAEQVRLIVKDLKLFSRGDEESRGPVDVQRLLDSSARLARNEVRHRARLIKDWHAVPAVIANEARLGEVFVNLIVNAAQAIPEGRADDNEIRLCTRVADRGRVAIEIRDTGVGIPPEILGRIFDPFFTTKPIGVGTGLGLSICHRIVAELGGDIIVESARGRGTCFRVLLPAADAGRAASNLPAARQERKGRRASLLVIDDEALVRAFIARALADEHDITVEACAEDGLQRIENGQRFDAILCDVMMPQMTGIEFYQVLSVIEPEQAARIGFITGGAFTGGTQRFLDSTPNQKLEKPFRIDRLLSFVDAVLDGAKPDEPDRPPQAQQRFQHHA